MKRRAFLRLLGLGVAAAAVNPTALLSGPEATIAPPAAGPIYGAALYGFDLMPPARIIYPVLSPMRNALRR